MTDNNLYSICLSGGEIFKHVNCSLLIDNGYVAASQAISYSLFTLVYYKESDYLMIKLKYGEGSIMYLDKVGFIEEDIKHMKTIREIIDDKGFE